MSSTNETMLAAEVAVLGIVIQMIIKDRYPIKSELDEFVEEFQNHVHNSFSGIEDPDDPVSAGIFKNRGLEFAESLAKYISAASSGAFDDSRGIMGFTMR